MNKKERLMAQKSKEAKHKKLMGKKRKFDKYVGKTTENMRKNKMGGMMLAGKG